MADINQMFSALQAADAAGNADDARQIADMIRQQMSTPVEKPEDVGILAGTAAAAKRGVEQFGDIASGLGLAASKKFGTEEETRQRMQQIREEQRAPQATPGLSVADLERIYKERGLFAAAAETPKFITEQVAQMVPTSAAPLAVGAGVGAAASPFVTPIGGAVIGTLAGIGTYGIQQFGNFMVRQAQEKNDPRELDLATAAITAGATAPLGYFADRFTAGLGSIGSKKAGTEILKEISARQAAAQVGKRVAVGATEGIIAEAPLEVLEQAAERYQAGLSLTGDDAMNEYKEAFFGAAAAGGAIGGGTRGVSAYNEVKAAQAMPAPAPAEPPPVIAETPQAPVEPVVAPPGSPAGQDIEAAIREVQGQPMYPAEPSVVQPVVEPVPEGGVTTPVGAALTTPVTPEAEAFINKVQPKFAETVASIASDPNYYKVGKSSQVDVGAPIVTAPQFNKLFDTDQLPSANFGKIESVTTNNGQRIPVQYAVLDAKQIETSHNAEGQPNPEFFNTENPAIKTVAGNARAAGLKQAYAQGTATPYKDTMIADDLHGIDRAVIEGMEQPVLVRVVPEQYLTNEVLQGLTPSTFQQPAVTPVSGEPGVTTVTPVTGEPGVAPVTGKPTIKVVPQVNKAYQIEKPREQIAAEMKQMKTAPELAQWAVDNAPNAVAKHIAEKVKIRIDQFAERQIPMKVEVLNGNRRRKNAYGSSRYDPNQAGNFHLKFNGLDTSGKADRITGTRYSTVLHELIHTASQAQLYVLGRRAQAGNVDPAYKELESLLKIVRAQAKKDRLNPVTHPAARTGKYFDNVDELLAHGLTDEIYQDYLSGIKIGNQTAFSKLVEIVRKMLGIDSQYESALDALMRATETVFEPTADEIAGKMRKEGVGFGKGEQGKAQILKAVTSEEEQGATEEPQVDTKHRNFQGNPAPLARWTEPDNSKMDDFLYKMQDKHIDTKRILQAIQNKVGKIAENWDAYLKEELYHGRTATAIKRFLKDDLTPMVKEMKAKGISIEEFDKYLHARHAGERNNQIAKINPELPDAGSGMTTAEAEAYLAGLPEAKRKALESIANRVDKIIQGTQKILVKSGLEEQSTIDVWNETYKNYVPLMREDLEFSHSSGGTGGGFSTVGGASKRAMGSTKEVGDIFANIAAQREKAIIRSEKARVGRALYGLALLNPNTKFWLPINPDAIKDPEALAQELRNMGIPEEEIAEATRNIIQEPKQPYIKKTTDNQTGLVGYRVNPTLRRSDNVLPVRIDGKDRYIFFNPNNERAMRMASALKNLDAEQLGYVLGMTAKITRWIASVNTQYNPVFGAYNFIRDVSGAQFNLQTTPIAGEQAAVTKGVYGALTGIYADLRNERDGKEGKSEWSKLWRDFQEQGGATGYREQFAKSKEDLNIVESEMKKLDKGNIVKLKDKVFNWLSDYNDSMENAVRLSAYKVALDKGLSKERAASIAKNLTVNFNRKGERAQQLGALYAFFNASVQGTARLAETLVKRSPDGKYSISPLGKKIIGGGLMLGSIQALALAAAGFKDDEPPEFIRERNLVIPTGGSKYIAIPMPLGLHVIPNIGRITTEMVLNGGKDPAKKVGSMLGVFADAFNPIGNAGLSMQTLSPTITDPLAALAENRDNFGRPIAKQDRGTNPTPGYTRSRDTASIISKSLSEFLNYASGGTKYQKGLVSPTADQLDYLIGQATGGVGRELMKGEQAVSSIYSGEELPSYKVPLIGKFYGDVESQASQANRFYENITKMANYENEIKGRQKNRENVQEFLAENPAARLYSVANNYENQITELNRRKKDMLARNVDPSLIKRIEDQKTTIMKRFNEQVDSLEK